jgi:hypothetical protein
MHARAVCSGHRLLATLFWFRSSTATPGIEAMRQDAKGIVADVTGETIELDQSAVRSVDGERVELRHTAAQNVHGDSLEVSDSAMFTLRASNVEMRECGAFAIIGENVTVKDSGTFLLVARRVEGNVRTALTPAAAFGLAAGVVVGLGITRRLLRRS